MLDRGESAAPDLVDAEVFSCLVRAHKSGRLSAGELTVRVELLREMDLDRYPARDLLVAACSGVAALSGYDALYATLASVLHCPLLTTDSRFAATALDQLRIPTICIPSSGRRTPNQRMRPDGE